MCSRQVLFLNLSFQTNASQFMIPGTRNVRFTHQTGVYGKIMHIQMCIHGKILEHTLQIDLTCSMTGELHIIKLNNIQHIFHIDVLQIDQAGIRFLVRNPSVNAQILIRAFHQEIIYEHSS